MKIAVQTLILIGVLSLISCSGNSNSTVKAPNAANTVSPEVAAPTTSSSGASAIKGVNKTVNGVSRVGNAVRSVRLISGLF